MLRVPMTKALYRAWRDCSTAGGLLSALGASDLADGLPGSITLEHLMAEARHQADLLSHPYTDEEHVRLAALRLLGRREDWLAAHSALPQGLPRGRWRPRGRRSAARRAGRAETSRRQAAAADIEAERPWP